MLLLVLVAASALVHAAHHHEHHAGGRRVKRQHRVRNAQMDVCIGMCKAIRRTMLDAGADDSGKGNAAAAKALKTPFPAISPAGAGVALNPALAPARHLAPALTAARWDDGPCLSEWPHTHHDVPAMQKGWVCDVAHRPRQTRDDEPANQCKALAQGKATRYCEVDTDCLPIGCN